jgi:HEAT repeat protein
MKPMQVVLFTAFIVSPIGLPLTTAFAAVPSISQKTTQALRLPLSQRIAEIEKQGTKGKNQLAQMAFDQSQPLENRWRAITALGRVYPNDSRETLEKALKSPEWYMRNAALVVVPYNNRDWAIQWARILAHDPALVVRTAAVNALRQLHAVEAQDLLWEKLYSSENYKGGQSLWVRKHIVETLAQFTPVGSEGKFIAVLKDKDRSLHPAAVSALERLTRQRFATQSQWLAWWDNSQAALKSTTR